MWIPRVGAIGVSALTLECRLPCLIIINNPTIIIMIAIRIGRRSIVEAQFGTNRCQHAEAVG